MKQYLNETNKKNLIIENCANMDLNRNQIIYHLAKTPECFFHLMFR